MLGKVIDQRYLIEEKLGKGGMSEVYRAKNIQQGQEVALKILKEEITSGRIEDLIRFRREATVVSKLTHPHIVKVLGLGNYEGLNYLVMELIKGKNLADLIQQGKKFSIDEAIEIIIQITDTLGYVHSLGIIHRDLKPGNIMVLEDKQKESKATHQIKILDFGLAQVMELTQIKDKEDIVGTFSYMSPEQSGIIKRPTDERSDLYSLGIIFYQLLTRELPFKGKDVASILHQQMAKMAVSARRLNPQIPELIDEILLKLLRKDPEERYQSTKGLLADLTRYQSGQTSFPIGKEDRLTKLSYRTRLIGRDEELNRLKEILKETQEAKGKLCLVAGEAGRGKSRLIEELRGYSYEHRGMFLTGRCFAQENKIPYQPFRDALNEYIDRFQRQELNQKEKALGRMKQSLGQLGQIITRLNPNMEELLGKQPELIPLDPERENRRFLMVASQFFCNLGEKDSPLILFLDDLQWADEASLGLLKEIIAEIKGFPLLILGAYRDNEVTNQHSLIKLRDEAKDRAYPLDEIKIDPFDHGRLNKLISELLLEDEQKTYDLSQYVLDKSKGNPFFAIEITRQLVDEGALIYDQGHWKIDWQKIEKITVSPNIVEVVLRRIEILEEQSLNLLSYAAVIGREFEIGLLFPLTDLAQERVITIIDEAISLQLLERSLEKGKLLFVHDRIKDAFYQRIGKERKRQLHFQVAKTIEDLHQEDIDKVLFDLAHHYTEADDKDKSLRYALPAAVKAKQNYANEEAIRYYTITITLLEEKGQKANPQWIEAKEGLVEVYLTTGRNDEAIEMAQQLLPLKETPIEKTRVYRRIGSAYFKKGNWQACEDTTAQGLALLGEKIPRTKPQVRFSLLKELLTHIFHCLLPKAFIRKEGKPVEPKYIEALWSYVPLGWMYILSDIEKFARSVLKMLNLTETKMGKSKDLGLALGVYGSLCMAIPLFKRGISYHQKAIDMKKVLNDAWGIAQSLQFMGFCYSWKGEYQKSIEIFQESKDKFQKMGDMWELGMTVQGLGIDYFYLGNYVQALEIFPQYLEISQKVRDDYGVSSAQGWLSLVYTEKGDFDKAEEWGNKSTTLSEAKKVWYISSFANTNLGYLEIERGNYEEAIKYLEKAKKIHEENAFLKEYTIHVYPHLAEAYVKKLKAEGATFKVKEQRQDLKKTKKACKEALRETKSWASHYGGALRVSGKYYALAGEKTKAEKYFLRSIEHCRKLGRRYELARTYYEYGNFLKNQDREEQAKRNWQKAYDLFKEIEARVYLKRTAELLGIKKEEKIQERLTEKREISTLITAGQYLSSILELERLLEKIMDVSMQVSGAERGFLLLYPLDKEKETSLEVKVARNIEKKALGQEEFKLSRTIIKKAEAQKQALIITDATADDDLKSQTSVVKYGLRSILCVPLISKDKMLGILYLDNRLISGLFTQEQLALLKTLSTQAAISIENALLYKEVQGKARMEEELELGRGIQMGLLPKESPKLKGLEISGYLEPAREIGGDYYDYLTKDQDRLAIIIGDVSGKGVAAGLLMSMAKATLYAISQEERNPKTILTRTNKLLFEYMQAEKFMSLLYLEYDTNTRVLNYCSAGHQPILIFRDQKVEIVKAGGLVLGMKEDIEGFLTEEKLQLKPKDKIILYTDGVIEAENSQKERFGLERLKETIAHHGQREPQKLIQSIREEIDSFTAEQPQYDDITMVVMGVE